MNKLAAIASGRRSKWLIVVLWLIAAAIAQPVGAKLTDETTDDTESFLPESAESTEVVRILDDEFETGETTNGIIVYQREGGLTAEDKDKIVDDAVKLQIAREDGKPEIPLTEDPQVPFQPGSPPGLVSKDGDVAYTYLTVPTADDFDTQGERGIAARDIIEEDPGQPGLQVLLTGDLGFGADAHEVFDSIDAKLLLATVLLVLVLLGAIYRAVLVALSPLIVVFFAYTVATAFIYAARKGGRDRLLQQHQILVVLMFGVGTDYCLLTGLPIPRGAAPPRGQARGHARTPSPARAPPSSRSGLTVSLAMLVLRLADAGNTSSLGPVAAIGVFTAHGRRPHPASGAAHDLRPPRLLAAAQDGRLRPPAGRRGSAAASGGASATGSSPGRCRPL